MVYWCSRDNEAHGYYEAVISRMEESRVEMVKEASKGKRRQNLRVLDGDRLGASKSKQKHHAGCQCSRGWHQKTKWLAPGYLPPGWEPCSLEALCTHVTSFSSATRMGHALASSVERKPLKAKHAAKRKLFERIVQGSSSSDSDDGGPRKLLREEQEKVKQLQRR